MRIFTLAVIAALTCFGMTSCDDTTDTLGASLTDNLDLLKVTTDTFNVSSRSLTVDSVLSRNTIGYLGKIRANPKYIKEYLTIYIRHIFGYSAHKINYSCDLQKEISDSLKHKSIDPFTYFRSTIPIKKYTVNYKDNEYTNIMKVGFVFNGDINKIDSI